MSKVGVQKKDIKEEGGWPYWAGRGRGVKSARIVSKLKVAHLVHVINTLTKSSFFLKKSLRGRHCKDYIFNSFILKPLVDTEFLSPDVQLKLNHCYH